MANDMVARMGLDDAAFRKGLRELTGATDRTGARMEGSFKKVAKGISTFTRMAVVGRAVRMGMGAAGSAIEAYAKSSEDGARAVAEIDKQVQAFKASIGEGLVPILAEAVGWLKELDSLRKGAVNWVADLFGGDSAGVDQAAAAAKEQGKAIERARAFREEMMKRDAAGGDFDAGLRLAREQAKMERAALDKQYNFDADQEAALAAADEANFAEKKRRHELEAAENAAQAREKEEADNAAYYRALIAAERESREHAERRTMALAELDWEIEQMRILELRSEGEGKIADAKQRELELARKIAAINADDALSADDRADAVRRITEGFNNLADAEDRARNRRAVTSFSAVGLGSGLGGGAAGAQLQKQVFGVGMASVDRRVASIDKKLSDVATTLKSIDRKVGGAVYAG